MEGEQPCDQIVAVDKQNTNASPLVHVSNPPLRQGGISAVDAKCIRHPQIDTPLIHTTATLEDRETVQTLIKAMHQMRLTQQLPYPSQDQWGRAT